MMPSESIHQDRSLATYTAFFRLSVDEPTSTIYFYVELLTRLIFEVSLPLSLAVKGSKIFPIMGFRAIRTWWTHEASELNQQVTSYAVAVLILANLTYLGYMIKFYTTRRSHTKLPRLLSKVMQSHILWACGPLYIPYISIPLNYISCEHLSDHCTFFKVGTVEIVFFITLVLLHTAFSLVYSVSVFDWSPFSHYCGAQAHSRVNIEATVCKAVVSIIFELVIKIASPAESFGLAIFCSCYHFFIAVSFWYDLPYFKMAMNKLMIAVYVISFMGSISVFVRMLVHDPDDVLAISMFFVGALLILPSVSILTNWRKQAISAKPVDHLSNATEVDIKVRAIITRLQNLMKAESIENIGDCKFRAGLMSEIEDILSLYSETYRNSFKINLVWATYVFHFKKNKFLAMRKLRSIVENSPSLLDILPVQIRIRYFSEVSSGEEAALVSYDEQLRQERYALFCAAKCLSAQLRFWGTLASDEHSLEYLESIGHEIKEYSEKARVSLSRMIALDPKNPSYRKLFAEFLEVVVNDEEGASRQKKYASECERLQQEDNSLTNSANCIFVLSAEKESCGQILDVNRTTCTTFGITRDEVLGKKINTLMPKMFAHIHDMRLSNYIENKNENTKSLIARNGVVCKFGNGFIGEGLLRVREYANFTLEPSITFFGALTLKKPRPFCLVKKSDLIIHEVSGHFVDCFGPDVHKVFALEVSICNYITSFLLEQPKIDASLKSDSAYTFTWFYQTGTTKMPLLAIVTNLPYLDCLYYHITIMGLDESLMNDSVAFDLTPQKFNSSRTGYSCEYQSGAIKASDTRKNNVSFNYDATKKQSSFRPEFRRPNITFSPKSHLQRARSANKSAINNFSTFFAVFDKQSSYKNVLFPWIVIVMACLSGIGIGMQWYSSANTISRSSDLNTLLSLPIDTGFAFLNYVSLLYHNLPPVIFKHFEDANVVAEQGVRYKINDYYQSIRTVDDVLFRLQSKYNNRFIRRVSESQIQISAHDAIPVNSSFSHAIHLYITAMGGFLNHGTLNYSDSFPFNFIQWNKDSQLADTFATIKMDMMDEQNSYDTVVMEGEVYFAVGAVLLVLVLSVVEFLPGIYTHISKTLEIFEFFEAIDKGRLRELFQRAALNIRKFDQMSQVDHDILAEGDELMEVLESKMGSFSHLKKKEKRGVLSRTHRLFTNRFTWKLCLIYIVTFAFFFGARLWWWLYASDTWESIEKRTLFTRRRSLAVQQILSESIRCNPETNELVMNVDLVRELEVNLRRTNTALYLGDPEVGIALDLRELPGGVELYSLGSCELIELHGLEDVNRTECEEFMSGVLKQNGYSAMVSFLEASGSLRRDYRLWKAGVNSSDTDTMTQEEYLAAVRRLNEFGGFWLPMAMSLYDAWLQQSFYDTGTLFLGIRMYMTLGFIGAMVLLAIFCYYPMIERMKKEFRATRSILSIIPDHFLDIQEKEKSASLVVESRGMLAYEPESSIEESDPAFGSVGSLDIIDENDDI
jgi:PAS domain S-box-containing protein